MKIKMVKKVKLLFDKVQKFLERNEYFLTSVYSSGEHIKFLECRTPHSQKTFVVIIPEKYILTGAPSSRLNIVESQDPPSIRQLEYISDVRGVSVSCDLVAISSESVCMYPSSGKPRVWYISEETEEEEEEIPEASSSSKHKKLDTLEADALRVLQKVRSTAKLPKAVLKKSSKEESLEKELPKEEEILEEDLPKEGTEEESLEGEKVLEEEGEEEFIEEDEELPEEGEGGEGEEEEFLEEELPEEELVFENEDGEPYDELKDMLDVNVIDVDDAESSLRKIQDKLSSEESESADLEEGINLEEDDEVDDIDNSLPPEIEEDDFVIGFVYISVNLQDFFRNIVENEARIIECYEQLDENISEIRDLRYKKLKNLTEAFLNKTQGELANISEEEKTLKIQLIRLTVVLAQSRDLIEKLSQNPSKYGALIEDSEKIHEKTKNSIYELNLELLRLRESADELLSNYTSTIQNLVE